MKKRIILIFLFFAVVVGVFYIRRYRRSRRGFMVKEIVVDGARYLKGEEIITRSGVEINSFLKKSEKKEAMKRLEEMVWIRSVNLKERTFGQLVIDVVERRPIAIVRRERLHLLCSDGMLIPYCDDFSDLPSVVINSSEDLSPFVSRIKKIRDLFTPEPITIYFRENEETVVKIDGFKILLGSNQSIPVRAELYRIIEEMRKEGYSFCDVRFKNQIIFEKGGIL
jgi:cell division septal protein FtsQ